MLAKNIFSELVSHYTNDRILISRLWDEIEKRYSGKKRYYHTLDHIGAVLAELTTYKSDIQNWHTVLFSVFYHDIIYNVLRRDNEEKSAALAANSLEMIGFPGLPIKACVQQILTTKKHEWSDDPDTNLFTDADLSILGQEKAVYEKYCSQIRKEYAIYPDIIYKPGRAKLLNHFLRQERIFKTDVFFSRYEMQARKNLSSELSQLI